MQGKRAIDETGKVYTRLTVLERIENKGRYAMWLCRCSCGTERNVSGRHLRSGEVRSCGCLAREFFPRAAILASMTKDPTYSAAHKRITAARGPAEKYLCVDCGATAREWSYNGLDADERRERVGRYILAYSGSPEFYEARCKPCHVAHDGGPK